MSTPGLDLAEKTRLSILIPCFNEVENVKRLPAGLSAGLAPLLEGYEIEIILVDDGSDDGTWEQIQMVQGSLARDGFKAQSRRHQANRGLGAAIRTGVQAAEGEILVTTDSDGTYEFCQIDELVGKLEQGADIVTASPYHPRGGVEGVPAYRLVLSKGSSWIYRILVDPKIYTYTALFRAYRRDVLEQIKFSADDFLAGTEILVNAWFAGFEIVEMPAVLRVRRFGTSKAKILRTILSHLKFQVQILGRRMGFSHAELKEADGRVG